MKLKNGTDFIPHTPKKNIINKPTEKSLVQDDLSQNSRAFEKEFIKSLQKRQSEIMSDIIDLNNNIGILE